MCCFVDILRPFDDLVILHRGAGAGVRGGRHGRSLPGADVKAMLKVNREVEGGGSARNGVKERAGLFRERHSYASCTAR